MRQNGGKMKWLKTLVTCMCSRELESAFRLVLLWGFCLDLSSALELSFYNKSRMALTSAVWGFFF